VVTLGTLLSVANHSLLPLLFSRHETVADSAAETPLLPARNPAALTLLDHSAPNACGHIYRSVCKPKQKVLFDKDFTGTVASDVYGEQQALQLYSNIINEHPDWERDQVEKELVLQLYTPKRVTRIETAFHYVQHQMARWIDKQPLTVFNAHEKKTLKLRLKHTTLQLPPQTPYKDSPDVYTKSDVFYERTSEGATRMRVGGAYLLSVKSWFNMVFTVAHELGHAIDPCEIRINRIFIPAYDKLSACFAEQGIIQTKSNRTECGQHDQLSEVFADWVAVQIVAEGLKSYSNEFRGPQIVNAALNSVRDLCEDDETDFDNDFHPSPQVRIGRIFGESPEIRNILGCTRGPASSTSYCQF